MPDPQAPPPSPSDAHRAYPCGTCGASLEFAPGVGEMRCPYCGSQERVAQEKKAKIREHDVKALFTRRPASELAARHSVCQGCGAHVQGDQLASTCQFCTAPLVTDTSDDSQVAAEAVLPFQVDRVAARDSLGTWARSRWFAPNSLKKVNEAERLRSTYLPHWTFDSRTRSDYKGQRGEYYYVTETYTAQENGKSVQKTRQVRKTRWRRVEGTVSRDFDDVLVAGTTQVDPEKVAALQPWPLKKAQPHRPEYLAGHEALRYDVEPETGLEAAKKIMAEAIEKDCRRDIGGDEQKVSSVSTEHRDVKGKLVLLPVWAGAYLHSGKSWQIVVNGCTGEVQGERPYSAVKITAAVLAALIVVIVFVLFLIYG
ncbi:hypothetical protein DFP74_4723 [Nocardiopsis sp. Huas11]|uniref:hypothetical protein n=1 Tax=Nocardiopsis sp. Huas11 TaxID=2183912 RepID=UPI000EB40868|nr:hypothetical protein [Nocardiopsis sp. Huas11]RKS08995.1 hypothetical protein DFP74_4723 [Nocardiopsis sp. Huas11]